MRYIEVEDLAFCYGDEPVLEDISYYVDPGEFAILAGENGATKSALIKNTLGLLKPASGKITVARKSSVGRKISIGYVPQQVVSSNTGFPSTVVELIRSGHFPRNCRFRPLTKKDHLHVEKALKSVDMWEVCHKRIGEFSSGQKQRISLTRVFATDPGLFISDKPTTGMDEQSRNEFYQLLQHSAHKHGEAILMITRDHEDIKTYMGRRIRLVRKEDSKRRCFHMNEESYT